MKYYQDGQQRENIYVYNRKNKNIDVFTKTGDLIKQYTQLKIFLSTLITFNK